MIDAAHTTTRALERAASLLRELGPTGRAAALTGAGISVESGIPDFRSAGGIWERYPPEEYATIQAFRRDPVRVWRFLAELAAMLADAQPNPAHRALAGLERSGHLAAVVTQNVDSLHQRAGSARVIEYHGSGARLACTACGGRRSMPVAAAKHPCAAARAEAPPRCPACGAFEKPDVVLFGEAIPGDAIRATAELVERCDLWIVAGTSALVHPAAAIPVEARARGATVIEMNLEPALFAADVRVLGKLGDTLPRLAALVGESA